MGQKAATMGIKTTLSLLSLVRRPRYQQAVHRHPNPLNRRFDQTRPNQFWVTDIACIPLSSSHLFFLQFDWKIISGILIFLTLWYGIAIDMDGMLSV